MGGEGQAHPFCCQIGLGPVGSANPGNQNTVTFPRTLIHLKLCSNNLDKQIYYAILCYAVLTSMTVAVLTLLYLLLAHIGSIHCSHSEHVHVLNLEVLLCQYLSTTLLNMLFISSTMLSLFLWSLQAPLSTTCLKFGFFSPLMQEPNFLPQHLSLSARSPAPTCNCPTLSGSIPQARISQKQPGTSCQDPWDLRKALF